MSRTWRNDLNMDHLTHWKLSHSILCEASNWALALCFFDSLLGSSMVPDAACISSAITACSRAARWELAVGFVEEMRIRQTWFWSAWWSLVTPCQLVWNLEHRNMGPFSFPFAYQKAWRQQIPDLHCHNGIINAMGVAKRWQEVGDRTLRHRKRRIFWNSVLTYSDIFSTSFFVSWPVTGSGVLSSAILYWCGEPLVDKVGGFRVDKPRFASNNEVLTPPWLPCAKVTSGKKPWKSLRPVDLWRQEEAFDSASIYFIDNYRYELFKRIKFWTAPGY